jgi:hypothetical protein
MEKCLAEFDARGPREVADDRHPELFKVGREPTVARFPWYCYVGSI